MATSPGAPLGPERPSTGTPAIVLIDAVTAASGTVVDAARAAGRRSVRVATPVARTVLHPPLLPARHHPGAWLADLARRGGQRRAAIEQQLSRVLDIVVPGVLDAVLRRVDLTAAVSKYVDLDQLVATVDLDAILDRLDLTAIVRDRVDLDHVVSTIDLDAAAARLDLDAVAARLDIDAVAARLDLDAVAARLDVDAVALRLDLDAVIARIDLVGLAEQVIDAIDLPEIIRESTASVTSDVVRGVRMQGIAGDEAVGRALERVFVRRGRRGRREPAADAPPVDLGPDAIPPQPGLGPPPGQP